MTETVSDTPGIMQDKSSQGRDPDSLLPRSPDKPLPQFKADRWGFPALLILALAMATISWQKWADLIVDYGQQVYIPWQLSQGEVLYKDLTYLHGPLSAYLHAFLFQVFGVGIMTLAWFNLGLTLALTGIIFYLTKGFADRLTAYLASLAYLGAFAFGQYALGGNYNFVCAYVYELSHGIILSLLAFLILASYLKQNSNSKLIGIGLLTGLIYLTKPEVFLATTSGLAFGLCWGIKNSKPKSRPQSIILFLMSALIPPILFLIYFSIHMSTHEAAKAILSPWLNIFNSQLTTLPLYEWVMGFNDPFGNLWKMFLYGGTFVLVYAGLILINNRYPTEKAFQFPIVILLGMSWGGICVFAFYSFLNFLELARPWPLLVLAFGLYLAYKSWSTGKRLSSRDIGLLSFILFAFVLTFKMILNFHIYHYGFALALPATLALIILVTHHIPQWVQNHSENPWFMRAAGSALLIIFIGSHTVFSYRIYEFKGLSVGSPRDLILDYHDFVNPRGQIMNAALQFIENNFSRGENFITLPDSIMLNYLARRKHPIKDTILSPPLWKIAGDAGVLKQLEEASSPYIVFVDREFPYFGEKHFGKDYGNETFLWVQSHYELIQQFGPTPFTGQGFGIQIYKLKISTSSNDQT